jgi:DNA-binding response OmpR family regulator
MKILIIEDEPALAQSMIQYLVAQDYRCEQATTYSEAIEKISLYTYDCILLDLMLPDGNGLEVLKHLRKTDTHTAVLIISAKGALDDKIRGIRIGADDYLAKPFHLAELSARIYALIRRSHYDGSNIICTNNLKIDLHSKEVTTNGTPVALTKKEYDLLLFFVGNKNSVISKNALAEHLSGDMADMFDNHDFVYAHIKNLKGKLNKAGCPKAIHTFYGMGYKWVESRFQHGNKEHTA